MDVIPNMPQPVNGMIRVYNNAKRTFSRPYSAKNVFFYKEGDDYFHGVRIPVTKARYKTMDALMDDLNLKIPLDFGVRRVCTPNGKTPVDTLSELEHMGRYICTSTNRQWTRGWQLNSVSHKHQKIIESRMGSQTDSYFTPSQAQVRAKENYKKLMTTSTPPLKSSYLPRQIVFVLHKDRERMYRSFLRPSRLPSMDALLTEISQSFMLPVYKMFTFEGRKIITVDELMDGITKVLVCQRNEKPFSDASHDNTGPLRFPPIPKGGHVAPNVFQRTRKPKEESRMSSGQDTVSSVELPPLNQNSADAAHRRRARIKRKENETIVKNGPVKRMGKSLSPRREKFVETTTMEEEGKPRKPRKKLKKTKKPSTKEVVEDISDIPDDIVKMQAVIRGFLIRKSIKNQNKAASKIQDFVQRKKQQEHGEEEAELTATEKSAMHKSAVMVQTAFRGKKARKLYKTQPAAASAVDVEQKPPTE